MNKRVRELLLDPLNLVAVLGALTWSVTAILGRPIGDFGVETDFYGDIVPKGRQWVQGHPVISGFRGPFYYIVIGILEVLFRDAFMAGKLLAAFSAAIGIRVAGGLLRRLFNPMVGVAGGLFLAANIHFVWFSIRASTDLFFWALLVGCLSILLADGHSLRQWAIAGLLAGVVWLTRYNGLALLPAAAIIAVLNVRPLTRGIQRFLVFAGGWAILAAPWAWFLWRETGNPFWNTNFRNIATEVFTFNPSMAVQGKFWSAVGFESMGEVYGTDPGRFLATMGSNVTSHFWNDMDDLVGWFWSGAALLGLALTWKLWMNRRNLSFALAGLLTYAALIPVFYNPRFMMPLLLWWSVGIGGLAFVIHARLAPILESAAGSRSRKPGKKLFDRAQSLILLILAALAGMTSVAEIRASIDPSHTSKGPPIELVGLAREAKATGTFFGSNTPIAARKPHVGYYLGAPYLSIPFGTIDDIRQTGAHFLLASSAEASLYAAMRSLAWLDDPKKIPRGLKFVARFSVPVGNDYSRVASLYAIENPIKWTPRPSRPSKPERPVFPGLTRIESLRLRLANWYHLWEPFQDAEALFESMSPSAQNHPLVLQSKGIRSILLRNLEEAEGYYRAAADADSGNGDALLGIASSRYLRNDNSGFNRAIGEFAGLQKLDVNSLQAWYDLGLAQSTKGNYAGALAPFAICFSANQESPTFVENLGFALQTLGWYERAKGLYENHLAKHPGTENIQTALEILQKKLESPEFRSIPSDLK